MDLSGFKPPKRNHQVDILRAASYETDVKTIVEHIVFFPPRHHNKIQATYVAVIIVTSLWTQTLLARHRSAGPQYLSPNCTHRAYLTLVGWFPGENQTPFTKGAY